MNMINISLWGCTLLLIMFTFYFLFKRIQAVKHQYANISFYLSLFIFLAVHLTYFTPWFDQYEYLKKMIMEVTAYFIVVPLLLFSFGNEYLRSILWNIKVRKVFLFLTKPFIALVLFYSFFFISHYPQLNLVMIPIIDVGIYIILFAFAIILWIPIIIQLPEFQRISKIFKLLYIFLNGVLLFFVFIPILILDEGVMGFHLNDLHTGATTFMVVQEFVLCIIFAIVIHDWTKKENKIDSKNVKAFFGKSIKDK